MVNRTFRLAPHYPAASGTGSIISTYSILGTAQQQQQHRQKATRTSVFRFVAIDGLPTSYNCRDRDSRKSNI